MLDRQIDTKRLFEIGVEHHKYSTRLAMYPYTQAYIHGKMWRSSVPPGPWNYETTGSISMASLGTLTDHREKVKHSISISLFQSCLSLSMILLQRISPPNTISVFVTGFRNPLFCTHHEPSIWSCPVALESPYKFSKRPEYLSAWSTLGVGIGKASPSIQNRNASITKDHTEKHTETKFHESFFEQIS